VLFTPEEDPFYLVIVLKTDKAPDWAKEKGFNVLKIT